MSGALSGVKVVEMGQLIAGPFCGQLMGDMGAEVIKLEPPGAGDPMRSWGQGDAPAWWQVIARNKKSVSLNLREPRGQAIARRLIAQADVLIENFRPGTLEKWDMAPEALHHENPGLIIVRVSGYGQTGPYAQRAGFGGIGEAMGGWRAIVGEPDRPPSRMGVSIGDSLAATYACLGALAALNHRHATGKGQIVDSALYEAVLQVMESSVADYDASGVMRERTGPILPKLAPSNVYPCKDGEFLIGANQDAVFVRLCAAMDRPELAEDPRYKTHLARGENQSELDALISDWTRTLNVAELEALMTDHSVPAGRMFRPPDMMADPHYRAREALITVPTQTHGELTMQGVFPKLSETPGDVRTPAPALVGAHNEEILCGVLGLGSEDLATFKKDGVI